MLHQSEYTAARLLADLGSARGSITGGVVFLAVNAAFVWWSPEPSGLLKPSSLSRCLGHCVKLLFGEVCNLVFLFDVVTFSPVDGGGGSGGGGGSLISRQNDVNRILKNFKGLRQQFRSCLGCINSKPA